MKTSTENGEFSWCQVCRFDNPRCHQCDKFDIMAILCFQSGISKKICSWFALYFALLWLYFGRFQSTKVKPRQSKTKQSPRICLNRSREELWSNGVTWTKQSNKIVRINYVIYWTIFKWAVRGKPPHFLLFPRPGPQYRADTRFATSQWKTASLCNDVSHWLGANLESALSIYFESVF